MSFSDSQFDSSEEALVNDINMTPMIDVMLVLLIIFIITLPMINHAVKVDLPKAESQPLELQDKGIDIALQADGSVLWDKQPLSEEQLQQRIAVAAVQKPVPVLRVFADRDVRYESLAKFLSLAQGKGLSKIDFVTRAGQEPAP